MEELSDTIEISDSDESDNSIIELSSDSDSGECTSECMCAIFALNLEPFLRCFIDSQHWTFIASAELVFVDLRGHGAVEVKNHAGPIATVDELDKISEKFVSAIDSEDDDQLLNYANVTIRKRNRFRKKSNADGVTENVSEPAQSNSAEPKIEPAKTFLESLNGKTHLVFDGSW